MSTKSYLVTTLLLLAACVGTFAWLKYIEDRTVPLVKGQRADAYMTNAIATRTNSAGELSDELVTPLLVHFPEHDTTLLSAPHFIIFTSRANEPPWHITALHGRANAGITTLQLWNQVKLAQAAAPQVSPTIISTTALTIFPQQQFVATKQKVQAWQPNGLITAVGLQANLKAGTIDLLSQVYARLQPVAATANAKP